MARAKGAGSKTTSKKRAPTAAKVDVYALHKSEYVTPKSPVLVDVAPARYVAIEGIGEPGGLAFTTAVGALYNVAFTVKMARKFAGQDYVVAKLEGLWWGSGAKAEFLSEPRDRWHWRLMIRVPDFISAAETEEAIATLVGRGKPEDVRRVGLYDLAEGRCVQMLHVGSYDEEARSLEEMRAFAAARGLRFTGKHHEIYLSDPRRVAPDRLRTILRLPVRA